MNRAQIFFFFFRKKWKNVIISCSQRDGRMDPFSSGRPTAWTCVSVPLCECVTCLHSCLSAFQGFAASEAVSACGFFAFYYSRKTAFHTRSITSHSLTFFFLFFIDVFKKNRQPLNFLGCHSPHHASPGPTQIHGTTQLDVTQRHANFFFHPAIFHRHLFCTQGCNDQANPSWFGVRAGLHPGQVSGLLEFHTVRQQPHTLTRKIKGLC